MATETIADRSTALAKLREKFPAENIAKLPKVSCWNCTQEARQNKGATCKDHRKAKCGECGNYITTGHIHLDYVGHAETTDRLLDADPEWTWEPMAIGPDGLPAVDQFGGLWIRLTVAGVTRLGYGSADGKPGPNGVKEAIGDAIRNAAMRFGVALDLWAKTDLHADEHDGPAEEPERPAQRQSGRSDDEWATPAQAGPPPAPKERVDYILGGLRVVRGIRDDAALRTAIEYMVGREVVNPYTLTADEVERIRATLDAENAAKRPGAPAPGGTRPPEARKRALHAEFKKAGIDSHDARVAYAGTAVGRSITSTNDLNAAEVETVIEALQNRRSFQLSGRAAELEAMIASATTSDELAEISDRFWAAHEAGEISDTERDALISASGNREQQLARMAGAAA